jgi:SOS-response transcriptional repressor LexA
MTPNQKIVLTYIYAYWRENGHSPTNREISEGTSINSNEGITRCLARLKENGYITFEPRRPRSVKVQKLPTEWAV